MGRVADNARPDGRKVQHHATDSIDLPSSPSRRKQYRVSSHAHAPATPREQLIAAMGLAFDPFSSGVSEKDLAPDFGAMYVDLQPSLLKDLQRPVPSFVFADYGMGKTATRLALEYALRLLRAPQTLCVTYTPDIRRVGYGSAIQAPTEAMPLLDKHLAAIAREMSSDLIVQYIERLHEQPVAQRSPIQQRSLKRQAQSVSPVMSHHIRRAASDKPADGIIWRGLRPVVRHVAVTEAWSMLLALLATATRDLDVRSASWEETLYDVRALNFSQTFLLIDAIDDGTFDAETYVQSLKPLLAIINDLQQQNIYLKCFLPLAVKEHVLNAEELSLSALTKPPEIATITRITPPHLQKMLVDRFEAASTSTTSFRSLDWFGAELDESIQARLIGLADGSPRQIIELASALLDFHSIHGFRDQERLWLTPVEWKRFVSEVERHPPIVS